MSTALERMVLDDSTHCAYCAESLKDASKADLMACD